MKCAKSRNAKNSRSASGRAARVPGVAGRELGDDPRRGRPDVVDVQLGLGQSGDEVGRLTYGQSGSPACDQARGNSCGRLGLATSPSTRIVGVPLTPSFDIRSVAFVDPSARRTCPRSAARDVGLVGAGRDGQLDQLVVAGTGRALLGWLA